MIDGVSLRQTVKKNLLKSGKSATNKIVAKQPRHPEASSTGPYHNFEDTPAPMEQNDEYTYSLHYCVAPT